MNIFITTGTPEFLQKLQQKYVNEQIILMHGQGHSLLLHETERKTVFQAPRRYEVLASTGSIRDEGFFAFYNVAVTEEGVPVFEHHYKERANSLHDMPGFIAYRLLRPQRSDTYSILTQWTDASFYQIWSESPAAKMDFQLDTLSTPTGHPIHFFSSKPYVSSYQVAKDEG